MRQLYKMTVAAMAMVFLTLASCQQAAPIAPLSPDEIGAFPHATVLWISIDGLRHDYVARAHPPFIEKLAAEGAYSTALLPAFPTLTFPSHTTEVTGVTAEKHGITSNSFYDSETKQVFNFPYDGSLRQAEAIWTTATRQHVRTAVLDWPLSQMQTGRDAAAVFSKDKYDDRHTDAERLANLVAAYQNDTETPPLRLLMGYVAGLDHAGHRFGPDAKQVDEVLLDLDHEIEKTVNAVEATFEKRKSPNESLYVLITTDHGMAAVKTLVNPDKLVADDVAKIVYSGPIANVFYPAGTSPAHIAEFARQIEARLAALPDHTDCVKVYARETLPLQWGYRHPTRTGDIVLVAAEGCTFDSTLDSLVAPATANSVAGMHGYPVESAPSCRGYMVLWRDTAPFGGKDLGPVSALELHATVARILAIKPAPLAETKTLNVFP